MSDESSSVGARLAELGADLVTVEINTIVKSGISSEKMPQPEHALMDVAGKAWSFLIDSGAVHPKTDAEWDRDVQAGWSGWDACLHAVQSAMTAISPDTEGGMMTRDARFGKMERIAAACDQLKGILYDTSKTNGAVAGGSPSPCGPDCVISRDKTTGAISHTHNGQDVTYAPVPGTAARRQWIPLTARHLAIVRKIWEIGLEDIAFQTVMQLDGDIINRVDPAYSTDERLLRIHQAGVSASQDLWKNLVDIAVRILGSLADVLKK